MGRVAGPKLRAARIAAHQWFDAIWKNKLKRSRYNAYSWLSLRMKLNKDITHFGMFSPEEILRAISICSNYIERNRPDLWKEIRMRTARYDRAIADLKESL